LIVKSTYSGKLYRALNSDLRSRADVRGRRLALWRAVQSKGYTSPLLFVSILTALSATTWRDEMKSKEEARTQGFARNLIAKGYCALLVRSFAPGTSEHDFNLVLGQWGNAPPARLALIDDEGRLAR